MSQPDNNFAFTPKPFTAAPARANGAEFYIARPLFQRTAVLRAYDAYSTGKDYIEKLSSAYVVALGTRSADIYLMKLIRECAISKVPEITCTKCREATFGIDVIRAQLFPTLHSLRKHANTLIHHLDDPRNIGVGTLNVEGVFDYSYHLFEEQAELLFGNFPIASFKFKACKEHSEKRKARNGDNAAAA
jgi:hypothetical protein